MSAVNDKQIIAVWGSPGAGKTTLAVNLATILADSGYMTCLISASDHGELQAFFGTAIEKDKGLYAAVSNGRHVREALKEARPNLCVLEQDTNGDAYDVSSITPEQATSIISDLHDQFNFVIVDCTNYKEAIFTGYGLGQADKVLVCIPHRVSAATWHIANAQMLEAVSSKCIFVDVNTHEGGCHMAQLLESIDLPECELRIPYVRTAYLCENTSSPIVLQNGKGEKKYKAAVLKVIKTLLGVEKRPSNQKPATGGPSKREEKQAKKAAKKAKTQK